MRKSALLRLASALVLLSAVGTTGCIKKMLTNGQIESTRKGAAGMQTTADFEVARVASAAGLAQFEGMHVLAPDNEDAIYLLVRNYSSYAFAFCEDDLELAIVKGDDDMAVYHRERCKSLYTRAIEYGKQWMESKHAGFEEAFKSGKEEDMVAYLQKFNDKSDADILFWTGQAWFSRANIGKEGSQLATLYVGKAIMMRVIALDDTIERGSAHVIMGAYHARTGYSTLGEDSYAASKKEFDRAHEIHGGKALLGKLQMARTYVCRGKDESAGRKESFAAYRKMLQEVVDAEDALPEIRLTNAIAKRKAKRYLSQKWIDEVAREDCGWEL